jgi:hypothetical protein
MAEQGGFTFGVIVGIIGTNYFLQDPEYIKLIKEHVNDKPYGQAMLLNKVGSGQVAVIHGFYYDYGVCEMIADRLQAEGGLYGCSPITE